MADGAISYYIDHFVQTRVSKLSYGSLGVVSYNPRNKEHRKRPIYTAASGVEKVGGVFLVILSGVSFNLKKDKNITTFHT